MLLCLSKKRLKVQNKGAIKITKEQFKQIIKSNVLLPALTFEKPESIYKLFIYHIENGANFIIAPTYLYDTEKEKKEAIKETVNAAGDKAFVCGAIYSPENKTIFSGGKLSFDEYYNKIKKEAEFLYKNMSCAVMFLLGFETLTEAKYAYFAVREVCDLPVCILLDFKDKMTLSDGFDITSTVISLQSIGINALGVMADDCDIALDVILDMKEFSSVPLFSFPCANSFITPSEFSEYAHNFVNNKCVMFGGGKGTDERFTAQIGKELWQLEPFMPDFPTVNAICGKNQIFFMDFQDNVIGKNKKIIEINLENITKNEEVDELIIKLIENGVPPVCFASKDIEILERAVKLYPGRTAVKSDEYGEITAKEFGAVILKED